MALQQHLRGDALKRFMLWVKLNIEYSSTKILFHIYSLLIMVTIFIPGMVVWWYSVECGWNATVKAELAAKRATERTNGRLIQISYSMWQKFYNWGTRGWPLYSKMLLQFCIHQLRDVPGILHFGREHEGDWHFITKCEKNSVTGTPKGWVVLFVD